VTWPERQEVQSTTVVVVMTTIFFGFYLWALDMGFSQLMSLVLKPR
jgi:preprotein translocase subunit SecE